jgi:hypothetical protein
VFHAQECRNIGNILYSDIFEKAGRRWFCKEQKIATLKNQLSAQLQPQQPRENANLPKIDTKQLMKGFHLCESGFIE